jgi:hypothetical protein
MKSTRAEKIADKIVTLLSDFRLDPRQAGTYFARIAPIKIYERFDEFVQGAEVEMTDRNIREGAEKNVYRFFHKV